MAKPTLERSHGELTAALLALSVTVAACAPAQPAQAPTLPADAHVTRSGGGGNADDLLQACDTAAVVCVGEQHDDAEHHRFQLALMRQLLARAQRAHRPFSLGMEMFQRPYQPALDDFIAKLSDAAELRRESDWEERWGFDFGMYRPLLELARERGVAVRALNAPREITRRVARHGVDALPSGLRAQLPELNLDDREHRAYFRAAMGFSAGVHGHAEGHGHGHGDPHSAERFYVAQVIWDETMAQSAATWLHTHRGGQMMVVAGNGHCHDSAIASRVRRRLPDVTTVSLQLVSGDDEPGPHAASEFVVRLGRKPTPASGR